MKKTLRILAGISIGLCLLAALGYAALVWSLSKDDLPPFNDSAMRRPAESLPDGQNAFTHYLAAADAAQPPEDEERLIDIILGVKAWDSEYVRSLLERNEEAFEHIRRGNRLERCLMPGIGPVESFAEPIPYLPGWRTIVRMFELKAEHHMREGQPDESLGAIEDLLRFARLCEDDAANLLKYLVANSYRRTALKSVRNLIRSGIFEDRHLLRLLDALRENGPSTEGLVLALKSEYENFVRFADAFAAGQITPEQARTFWIHPYTGRLLTWFGPGLLYHPNRTRRDLAMFIQEMIDQAGHAYSQMHFTYQGERSAAYRQAVNSSNWHAMLRIPNFLGEEVLSIAVQAYPLLAKEKCEHEAQYRATILLAALHLFRNQHGHFPQTLDELVPGILPEVPADPFDGAPMRYSHEKGVVYSVAEDLEDLGGSEVLLRSGEDLVRNIVFEVEQREACP